MLQLRFKYDATIVEALKTRIPATRRKWNGLQRCWEVEDSDLYSVCAILKEHDPKLVHRLCTAPEYAEARQKSEAKVKAVQASMAVTSDFEPPAPPSLAYLPFQKAGIAFSADKPGVLIADEMGLGKTVEAIGIINTIKPKHILFIVPASLKINWRKELQKWLVDSYDIRVLKGAPKSKDCLPPADTNYIWVINYDILTKWLPIIDQRWDVIVGDECHLIKNYRKTKDDQGIEIVKGSGRAIYTFALLAKATRKILMTGTPIVNRPIDLWPIISALDPENWPSFWSYAFRYCGAYQGAYGWDLTGATNLNELQLKLRQTIMLRRLKKDVLKELPPKRRQIIEVPAGPEFRTNLEAEAKFDFAMENLRAALANIPDDDPHYEEKAVEIAQHQTRVDFNELSKLRHETAVAKLPACIEFIDGVLENKDKVVVFAHHRDVLMALIEHYGEAGVHLIGGDSPTAKNTAVERFQTDPSVRLFFGSILAAGVGLTLTAADTVVFCELDWVPGNLTQAEDRCHRIGQHDSVNIYHLVVEGSIDAKLVETIVRKQEICEAALNNPVPDLIPDTSAFIDATPENPRPMTGEEFLAPHPEDQPIVVLTPEDNEENGFEEVSLIDEAQREHVHYLIRYLAGMCDGARLLDGMGFNKFDAEFGKSLAQMTRLTDKQFYAAQKMLKKYARQLQGVRSPVVEALAQKKGLRP